MIRMAGCKINLGLHILSRRDDGYHHIETLLFPVPWADVVEAIPAESFSFQTWGRLVGGKPEENLCVKAWDLFRQETGKGPVKLGLWKHLPSGAGLGGGSSNAATVLLLLNELFDTRLTESKLLEMASRLGSDCPFFIRNKPAIASGRGVMLRPYDLSLRGYWLVILFPGIRISTLEAYALATPQPDRDPLEETLRLPVDQWPGTLVNDFEEPVFKKWPETVRLKESLLENGAVYASLSGSGSAVYGLFKKQPDMAWLCRQAGIPDEDAFCCLF